MSEIGYKSIAKPETPGSDFNAISFLIRQILSQANSAMLVQVKAVTNAGELAEVGFVDVQPMVHMLDGYGHPWEHTTIYHIPYLRIQGGTDAIILDPKEGDIGVAVFADKDISSVKANKAASNPGSSRRNDMADGLYMGGFLNGIPTQYIAFSASGIDILSPTKITCTAPIVSVVAATSATVTAPIINMGATGQTLKALVTDAFNAVYNGHTHNENGTVTSAPNQQISATQNTTTVKAG